MGRPVATRWKRPLVKARPAKVKGLDLLVNWDSGWPSRRRGSGVGRGEGKGIEGEGEGERG